ncbi:MAG: DUF4492 domain-containing protein [Bacteroidetes bacterium]|nr:DUF4492 domain-containing protein [Bacteroidota bacterium]
MQAFRNALNLYTDGFRNMSSLGKKLWLIILIKVFVLFVILRTIFFPDFLSSKFSTDEEKSEYVINNLIENGD